MEQKEQLRMRAYYFRFEPTGVLAIDKILSAICDAGKAYHHTQDWEDLYDYGDRKGKSHIDLIQEAANAAAKELKAQP